MDSAEAAERSIICGVPVCASLTIMSARSVFGSDEFVVWNVEQFGYLANQVILVHIDLEISMSDPPHVLYQLMLLLRAKFFVDQLDEWMIRGRSLMWLSGVRH